MLRIVIIVLFILFICVICIPVSFYLRPLSLLRAFMKAHILPRGDLIATYLDKMLALACAGPSIYQAEGLRDFLWSLSETHSLQPKSSQIPELWVYKSFHLKLEKLLRWRRDFGIGLKRPIERIKKQLREDIYVERQIRSSLMAHYAQYFSCLFVIWGFTFLLVSTLEVRLSQNLALLMIVVQMIGLISVFSGLKFLRQYYFFEVEQLYTPVEALLSLMPLGLSTGELLSYSQVNELESLKRSELKVLYRRFVKATQLWKEQGQPIEEALEEISSDLSFYRNQALEELKKKSQLLGFIAMAFFILPSFFIGLSGVIEAFLIE